MKRLTSLVALVALLVTMSTSTASADWVEYRCGGWSCSYIVEVTCYMRTYDKINFKSSWPFIYITQVTEPYCR